MNPGLRKQIFEYNPNDRDKVRKTYLQRGSCQSHEHNFPQRKIGVALQRFNPKWFKDYANWLEYNIENDTAFCSCCYLYKSIIENQVSSDCFVSDGFQNWKKKERFDIHVGGLNSAHNKAWKCCQ